MVVSRLLQDVHDREYSIDDAARNPDTGSTPRDARRDLVYAADCEHGYCAVS